MTSPIAWADLTDEQRTALLTNPAVEVDAGCELLATDLSVVEDLSPYLDATGGDVAWDGSATVHRDCSFHLAADLEWGTALLRLWQTLTDPDSGLSARRDVGVFCPHTPDRTLGETVEIDGQQLLSYEITGQDRLYLLNRQVGRSYVVAAATNVLDAVAQVFLDAGLAGVRIDSSAVDATVPRTMAWPLLSSYAAGSNANTADTGGAYTWLNVVNDLLALINYRGVWCDEDGFYRCGPYVDPGDAASTCQFDADDGQASTVAVDRSRSADIFDVPNTWIGIWTNMPDNAIPTLSNGGVLVRPNDDDGPASINARGGGAYGLRPVQVEFTAADADSFAAQLDAQVARDKRQTAVLTVNTAPFPCASHFDVFTYIDSGLPNSPVKVEAQKWTMPLDGGDVQWTWNEV